MSWAENRYICFEIRYAAPALLSKRQSLASTRDLLIPPDAPPGITSPTSTRLLLGTLIKQRIPYNPPRC